MSEDHLQLLRAESAELRRKAAQAVLEQPLAEQPPAYLKDGPQRMPADALAKRVALSAEDIARVGGRSTVIDRQAAIPVFRTEGSDQATGVVAAPPIIPRPVTGPRRADAADSLEKVSGVITIQPQVAGGRIVQPPVKTVHHVPAPAHVPPPTIITPPTMQVATGTPSAPTVKRVTVTLSSPTIGRHRLKVAQVLVSQSVVVLAYVDDDDSTIYEPPRTVDDQQIVVEHEGQTYQCVYLEMSVSQPSLNGGPPLLLVVLNRVDE